MFILAGINVLIVGGVEHHWWDMVQMVFYMLVLTRTVVATALSVAELNELVIEHREIIRAAKVRMCGGGEDSEGGGSNEDLRQSVMFLNAVDELIETREQTANPHKIFGIPATKQVVQSYLGIIASGLFFAAQTFVTSSSGYDVNGKYIAGKLDL